MKKLIAVILLVFTLFCLTSCDTVMSVINKIDLPFIHIDKNGAGVYEYSDFTEGEKQTLEKYIGALIPFVPCDKYSFEGVETSWRKMCYYYNTVG